MMKRIALVIAAVFFVCALMISPAVCHEVQSITSRDALALLKEGNARFVQANLKHPNQGADRREETARNGQKPFAIVLACSDSRVPVEILFDAGIGDIFVVRNAGNITQDDVIAGSIEYAAEHVHVPLLVIMGHTDCGAVNAALSDVPAEGNIRVIQKIIEPVAVDVKKSSPSMQGTELVNAVIKSNVLKSKTDLLARSEMIKHMSDEGRLKIVAAVYDIETGSIDWSE